MKRAPQHINLLVHRENRSGRCNGVLTKSLVVSFIFLSLTNAPKNPSSKSTPAVQIPDSPAPAEIAQLAQEAALETTNASGIDSDLQNLLRPEDPQNKSSPLGRLEAELKTRSLRERSFVSIRENHAGRDSVEITLSADSIFKQGSSAFAAKSEIELRRWARWISEKNAAFHITIESHTDDTPVLKHRKTFKSNWDLSAARAGAVAGLFQDSNFPKSNLEAIGLADSHPLGADRNQNRRIVLRFTDETRSGS